VENCNDIIASIYTHPAIDKLIRSIRPIDLQDDLRQELAIVLLSYDCKKIKEINENGNLIGMALRIVYKMGNFNKSYFFKKYKYNNDEKLFEYVSLQDAGIDIPIEVVKIAEDILNLKMGEDANSAHESMIFNKYIEYRSCIKVAEYFGIPKLHVFNVVKKMKIELKKAINNNNDY